MSKELVALSASMAELQQIIKDDLGDDQLSQFDLERVNIPAGGGNQWEVPSLDDEAETLKSLVGVIVYQKTTRSYWKESLEASGGGTPPDCASLDGATGIGDPGGDCFTCPLNQFPSEGGAKPCKEMRVFFLLQPDAYLPLAVSLPPTSIQPARKYLLRLASKGVHYRSVLTEIGLEKDKNAGGITYSKATFKVLERLSPDQVEKMHQYGEMLKPMLAAVPAEE